LLNITLTTAQIVLGVSSSTLAFCHKFTFETIIFSPEETA